MSDLLRETLTRRAEGAPVPAYDVEALVVAAQRRLRRRRGGLIAASVAAVVLVIVVALVGSALIASDRDFRGPIDHPRPTQTPSNLPSTQSPRKVLWTEIPYRSGVGIVHDRGRIHYGNAVLELEHAFVSTDVTDDGFLWVTPNHEVWFSDGADSARVGTHQCFGGAHGSANAVVTDDGSRAAWFDCSNSRRPLLVVHSTNGGEEVRVPVTGCARADVACDLRAMVGDHVYWQRLRYAENNQVRLWRQDLGVGTRDVVTEADLAADLRGQYRAFVVGRSWLSGLVSDGMGLELAAKDNILQTATDPDFRALGQRMWVAATGRPVHLRLPGDYHGANLFTLTQWLDDDTVALVADAGDWGPQQGWTGDIVRCRVSSGHCAQVVKGHRGTRLVLAAGQGLPG